MTNEKLQTRSVASFSSFMEQVEKFQEAHAVSWYRGSTDASYPLVPSLFRHPKKKDAAELHRLERDLASTFAQRSPPFIQQTFSDEWEQMYFMQHYGIPTRLLDWSESPLVALYFALTGSKRDKSGKPLANVCVWMLDPESWNRGALKDISYGGGVLDSRREQVKSYGPRADLEERKNLPVMIFGTHNSPRIVAQRGMFALFGKSRDPMEKSFDAPDFKDGILVKIEVLKSSVDDVARSLFRKGISDSTVYPDLVGLSLELRRTFGF